jgi:hypothetical protein
MRSLILLTALVTSLAQAQDKPASNMDLVRDKIRTDKKLLVGTNMGLTENEAKGFWPVYDAYQADLAKLNQRTLKMIETYAANQKTMTDAAAGSLLDEAIAIERDRVALLTSYRPKFAAVLPATKAARYYQIENKIRAVINYELADAIPIM